MKRARVIILLVAVTALGGCGKKEAEAEKEAKTEEKQESGKETSVTAAFPQTYTQEINGITFDTNIVVPDGVDTKNIKVGEVKTMKPQEEKVRSVLSTENDGEYCADDYLSYLTKNAYYIQNTFRIDEDEWTNTDAYQLNMDLGFETKEDAAKTVIDTLNQCGYELNTYKADSYALPHDVMEQQEVVRNQAGNETLEGKKDFWSEADDCYWLYLEQLYEGIPVYYGDENFPEDSLSNRPIEAIVNSEGIQYLITSNLYKMTEKEDNVTLCSFDTVAECVAHKYGDILSDASYKVTRASLYEYPSQKEGSLKPMWFVETVESGIDSESNEDYSYSVYTLVDAETGEEITW